MEKTEEHREVNMKPDRIPRRVLDVFIELWADEGFDLYWKVSTKWGRSRRIL